MNYLSHFVFNHDVRGISADPYFVMGVALPDLWPRFSRERRIRWRKVREWPAPFEARPAPDPAATALRDGLLNHVEADRLFHSLPIFLQWQRELRDAARRFGLHSAVLDFLCHVSIELALDHHLLRTNRDLAKRFYQHMETCKVDAVERRVSEIGGVDGAGLAKTIKGFIDRRFLEYYGNSYALVDVVGRIFEITSVKQHPPVDFIAQVIEHAIVLARPDQVWSELTGVHTL